MNATTFIEDAYENCPRCGTRNQNVGAVPFRCTECNFTAFFGPVAAVGALVANDQNRLLLLRRAMNPGKGCWGLPGGFVDRFETAETAVAREVREETTLEVVQATFMMSRPNKYNYKGVVSPVLDLFFRCGVGEGEIRLADGEMDAFEWVDRDSPHLQNLAFPSNQIAIDHWMKHH